MRPGDAVVYRDPKTGRRTVERADDVIAVAAELLAPDAGLDPDVWQPHDGGGILALDSDGLYRYSYVGPNAYEPVGHSYVFERIPAA